MIAPAKHLIGPNEAGELVLINVSNALQNRASKGKQRPVILIRPEGSHWEIMGLTAHERFADGTPRTPVPNPDIVGLKGPGFLWSQRLTAVSSLDVGSHLGWIDPDLADAVIDAAGLEGELAAGLRRTAAVHHGLVKSPTPENPGEIERVTVDAQESRNNAAISEPVEAGVVPGRTGRPWKTVALTVGGVIAVAAAVMVTLAATHKSAVRHNFLAYLNGLNHGYEAGAHANGLNDGYIVGAYVNGLNDGYEAYMESNYEAYMESN